MQTKYSLLYRHAHTALLYQLLYGDSSTFLKDTLAAFPKDKYPEHKTVVINVSSLLAVQPFSNWGLYAAGKAARDRFLGVIALEEVHYLAEPIYTSH